MPSEAGFGGFRRFHTAGMRLHQNKIPPAFPICRHRFLQNKPPAPLLQKAVRHSEYPDTEQSFRRHLRRRDESKNIMSQALPYRPDIDTLRAAAVLSVIVFHIEKNWLPGGFLGVDIFFVISGFLMTAILLREMSGGGEVFPEGILYPPHQADSARIFRRIGGNADRRLLFIHQR